jgi:hypothetical protein
MLCSAWIKKLWLWSVILAVIAGAGFCSNGCGQAPGAPAVPKMHSPATSHDFGQVSEEQELSHTFIMENTGKTNLIIDQVSKDCKCMAARYDRVIPPGGRGEITLTIKPHSVEGQFQKHAQVKSNDPNQPEAVLVLQGFSQRQIEFAPSRIIRLWGNPSEDLRSKVQVISHLPVPLNIKEFRTDIPEKIEVSLAVEEPGRVYALEIRNKCKEPNRYQGKIELLTTAPQHPQLIVRVFGYVSPNCNSAN